MKSKTYITKAKHCDVENGVELPDIHYHVYGNPAEDDGLLFFICPFGITPEDDYVNILLTRLHDITGLSCIAVDYFAMSLKATLSHTTRNLITPPEILHIYIRKMNLVIPQGVTDLYEVLRYNNVSIFPATAGVRISISPQYQSFGLLPALDHISVYSEICRNFKIKPSKVVVYGSSYGAYIAMILAKFLPNSISYLIENSSFHETQMTELNNWHHKHFHKIDFQGITFLAVEEPLWNLSDPEDQHYFSQSCADIRDLKIGHHFKKTRIPLFSFHGKEDSYIPLSGKEDAWEVWAQKFNLHNFVIDTDRVDGKLFKNAEHGIDASLVKLFELCNDQLPATEPSIQQDDFQRESKIEIDVAGGQYCINFKADYSFEFSVHSSS